MTFFTWKASRLRRCKRPFCLCCSSSHSDLGSAGTLTPPPGLPAQTWLWFSPWFFAEAVEKQINWIFHVQPVKLDRWSLTISSEGGKLLKTLHMRFPPPCHLEKQNEDVLRARRSPLHCPSHQKPWLKFLGNGE